MSGWHAAIPTCAKGWTDWRCWPSRCWQENPFSGALFAFRGKRGGLIKLLWFDGQGLCLFSKRLDKGHFQWPVSGTGQVCLTAAQLSMLLKGIDWRCPRASADRNWRVEAMLTHRFIGPDSQRRFSLLACSSARRPARRSCDTAAILRAALAEIERLQLQIAGLQRNRFGRRSEKLGRRDGGAGARGPGAVRGRKAAGLEAAIAKRGTTKPSAGKPPKRNRGALPAHLPRVEVIVDVADKTCACCGGPLHQIGEDRAEMLDYVPAQFRVRVIRRPRYGCRVCENAVLQAPAPDRPIDGGMATEALMAQVLIGKYGDHLPLYRQSQRVKPKGMSLPVRASRWIVPRYATGWVVPAGGCTAARADAETVLSSPKVFADDTTLPVLDPGNGRTKTGRLWCYAVDNRPWQGPGHPVAAYVYSEDRKANIRRCTCKGFRGLLQVDGYAGFGSLVKAATDGGLQLAFCWAHTRRKFYDIHATKSPLAEQALRQIAELYAIEAEFAARPPTSAARHVRNAAAPWSRRCMPG